MYTREVNVTHIANVALEVRSITESADGTRRLSGIASTPSVDRMGDVLLPMGAQFSLPLPLFWNHDSTRVMGTVRTAKVTPNGIEIEADFNPNEPDMPRAILSYWAQVKAGMVRFLSVGFRPLKSKAGKTGNIFSEWELLEVSAVPVPANPDCAITAVRAFPVPGRHAPPRAVPAVIAPRPHAGAAAALAIRSGAKTMNTAEKIASAKARLADMRQRVADLANADEIDDEASTEIEEITETITREERTLKALEAAHAVTMGRVTPVAGELMPAANAGASRQRATVIRQRDPVKADLIWKGLTAAVRSFIDRRDLGDTLARTYPGNSDLELFMKAATAPARTDVSGWASELVMFTQGEYIDALAPISVYAALTAQGSRFSFGRAGSIRLPGRGGTPGVDLAGDWIGEGNPIPVRQTTIRQVTLVPNKLAVISTFTRELALHSTPAIEALLRDEILRDTSIALDHFLLDNVGAGSTRPAGLLFGVTPVASTGAGFENMKADIVAAITAITANGGGRNIVTIMNPAQALAAQFMTDATGGFLFADDMSRGSLMGSKLIVSNNVPNGTVIVMDAADFASALGDVPAFDVSDTATLHMEGVTANVKQITGPTATDVAVPVRSLWQTASIGVRMIQEVSWGMRRPGMIYAISGVAW